MLFHVGYFTYQDFYGLREPPRITPFFRIYLCYLIVFSGSSKDGRILRTPFHRSDWSRMMFELCNCFLFLKTSQIPNFYHTIITARYNEWFFLVPTEKKYFKFVDKIMGKTNLITLTSISWAFSTVIIHALFGGALISQILTVLSVEHELKTDASDGDHWISSTAASWPVNGLCSTVQLETAASAGRQRWIFLLLSPVNKCPKSNG